MLYSYTYFDHTVSELHSQICDFFNKLEKASIFDENLLCQNLKQKYSSNKSHFKNYINKFLSAFSGLQDSDKLIVIEAFKLNNKVEELCKDTTKKCYSLEDLPSQIQNPLKELFVYLYENVLGEEGKIKSHYKEFYENNKKSNINHPSCPFCGLEDLLAPKLYKQDYDHTLSKTLYPMSAINMKNLAPMGRDCNTIFKKNQNTLFDEHKIRRKAFYPYDVNKKVTISLTGSSLPSTSNRNGEWKISINPDIEEIKTWETIFNLKNRYISKIEESFETWSLQRFKDYMKGTFSDEIPNLDKLSLKDKFIKYRDSLREDDYKEARFLQHSVLSFIINHADESFYDSLCKTIKNS